MNVSKVRNAVCAILSFENKIFYVRRQNYLRNFPGYHSFPGGKVNREEKKSLLLCSHGPKKLDQKLLGALEREVEEELGFSLESWQQEGFVKSIRYIAEAITPEFNPYRFATHYFFIKLLKTPNLILDVSEFDEGKWLSPFEFCELYEEGKILTVPPILEFSRKIAEENELAWIDFKKSTEALCPMLEPIKGLKQFMPLSNTLPPANRTNAFLIGDEGSDKVLVDPSPRDEEELEKFLKTIEPYGVTHLFITHHHKDHHEFAPQIARRWKLPIYLSELTYQYICTKRGEDYLAGIEIRFASHGQVLTTTRGIDVCVFAVPGHDLGQLALYPLDLSWFIAGDLFQGIGSVVIGGEESSMTKYFETLNKVIELSPYCVVPSHGIALGGTDILQKNLAHRQFRENQIIKLLKKNLSIDEMTSILYQGLPEKLLKYAKANVISHLKKINELD